MKKQIALALTILCALALVITLAARVPLPAAYAGVVPTPAITGWNADNVRGPVYYWNAEVLTASAGSEIMSIGRYEATDLQVIADVGDTNTTTLKLQFSNDGAHWVNGDTVATIVEDTNSMGQWLVFGWYARVYATLTNASPITVTVVGVSK